MNKSLRPKAITFWQYLLQLGLDTMLFLFPVFAILYLMGSGGGGDYQPWGLIGCGGLVLFISVYRIVSTMISFVAGLTDRRWWWSFGALIRLVVLGSVLYVSGIFLMILLGAGVSVGEPMG